MTQCQTICPSPNVYNAVKIKINNPKTNIPDKLMTSDGNYEFNSVNLEINNPEIKQKPIYSYPKYDGAVTYNMADIIPFDAPIIPIAYKTSFINNRTYITTDLDSKELPVSQPSVVPEPNLTSIENEKAEFPNFKGLSFKSQKPEIYPDAKIKPAVSIDTALENLNSKNYDIQAKQLAEIISAALNDKKAAVAYITTDVFSKMIEIAEKDTAGLEKPSEEQIEIRKKIIANEIVRRKELAEKKSPEEIKLPYEISKEDFLKAADLSQFELAERNKEYAVLTLAALTKVYADEFERKTGNIVPITDLPGISTMVEILKKSDNPSIKIAAIESLVYICREEYKNEISAVLSAVMQDNNQAVALVAADAFKSLQ